MPEVHVLVCGPIRAVSIAPHVLVIEDTLAFSIIIALVIIARAARHMPCYLLRLRVHVLVVGLGSPRRSQRVGHKECRGGHKISDVTCATCDETRRTP